MLVLQVGLVNAQYRFEWGQVQNRKGGLVEMVSSDENSLYAIHNAALYKKNVSYYEDLNLTAKKTLILGDGTDATAKFESAISMDGKLLVFYSGEGSDGLSYYMQTHDKGLEFSGNPVELGLNAKLNTEDGIGYAEDLSVHRSKNQNYFAVILRTSPGNEDNRFYAYKIFDAKLSPIDEGMFSVAPEDVRTVANNYYISDFGELFISFIGPKGAKQKNSVESKGGTGSAAVFQLKDGKAEKIEIALDSRIVKNMSLISNRSGFIKVSGVYSTSGVSISGLFYLEVDFQKGSVGEATIEVFYGAYSAISYSDRDTRGLGKAGNPSVYSYELKDSYILADGGIIGIAEQLYVDYSTLPNSGNMYEFYHYMDVFVYKVNSEGSFEWITKINKSQVTSDGGISSSYSSHLRGGQLIIFFNDNADNYNKKSGEFNTGSQIEHVKFTKKKYVLAQCVIDVVEGGVKRSVFSTREEMGGIIVNPAQFVSDQESLILNVYGGNLTKERFGCLVFGR